MADKLGNLLTRLSKIDTIRQEQLLGAVQSAASGKMSAQELATLVERLEQVALRLEKADARNQACSGGSDGGVSSPFVSAYQELVSGPFQTYMRLSKQIGGEVAVHADMVQQALARQQAFLEIAGKSKQPAQGTLMNLLKPTSDQIAAIQEFRERNRSNKQFFNHLSAISESIAALGWVTVAPTPAPFVKEMADASQFYTNRVLVDYKDKNKTHVDWARSWVAALADLQQYVKQFHTTGLTWNPRGGDAPSAAPGAGPRAPGGPVGPPPPPPPADFFNAAPAQNSNGMEDARAALFKDINRGEGITSALKKVAPDQMTHKNPALRAQAPVPAKTAPSPAAKPQYGAAAKPKGPPRCELDGKKWIIENQTNAPQIVLNEIQMNQSVCIYSCQNTVVMINGKCNSVSIDSCKKTSVVFGDIVSMVEFINCQSVQAQATGRVPCITIDKTDGAQVYLGESSLDCEVVTSKSSEVNVSIPKGDGDYMEIPVPEQFKTTVQGKSLRTEPVEKA